MTCRMVSVLCECTKNMTRESVAASIQHAAACANHKSRGSESISLLPSADSLSVADQAGLQHVGSRPNWTVLYSTVL